ncbi:MAG: hypothetical protein VW397_02495 [Candidatus Margulisiibacteriota bacterium]
MYGYSSKMLPKMMKQMAPKSTHQLFETGKPVQKSKKLCRAILENLIGEFGAASALKEFSQITKMKTPVTTRDALTLTSSGLTLASFLNKDSENEEEIKKLQAFLTVLRASPIGILALTIATQAEDTLDPLISGLRTGMNDKLKDLKNEHLNHKLNLDSIKLLQQEQNI